MNDAPIGRVYRTGFWYRMSYLFYVLFGSFALTVPSSRQDLNDGNGLHLLALALGAGMIVFGILFTINAFALRISFSNSGIEYSSFFAQVYLPYEAIRGRHEYVEWTRGRPHHLQLWPMDGSEPIDFKKGAFRFDNAFWNWFYALPDMDAKDKNSDVVTV